MAPRQPTSSRPRRLIGLAVVIFLLWPAAGFGAVSIAPGASGPAAAWRGDSGSGPGSGETTVRPPRVKIVTPRESERPSAPLLVQAIVRAVDGRAIRTVEAFLNGHSLGTLRSEPFRWKVARIPEASTLHIRVVASDAGGGEGADEIVLSPTGARFGAEAPAVAFNLTVTADERFVEDLRRDEIVVRDNGRRQEVLEFARSDVPVRCVLLLDRSRSMFRRIGDAKAAVEALVEQLGPRDEVMVVAFNDRATPLTPFTDDRARIARALESVDARGSTALYDAVLYGLERFDPQSGPRRRRALFVFTDGKDTDSLTSPRLAARTVRDDGITLFAVGQGEALEDDELKESLEEMAHATGGRSVFEEDVEELPRIFRRLGRAIRSLYFVSYRPSDLRSGWHRIQVDVRRDGVEARHKEGYRRGEGTDR